MTKNKMYIGLDIGTVFIKVILVEIFKKKVVNVIGTEKVKSDGVINGIIVDIEKVTFIIKKAIKNIEKKSGFYVDEVIVGIPSNLLNIEYCKGMIAIKNNYDGSNEISDNDIKNVVSTALIRFKTYEKQILSIFPLKFIVDGFDNIHDPRGMLGSRLEMFGYVVTGSRIIIHSIIKCIEKSGFFIKGIVVSSFALINKVLTEDEKRKGSIVIDMGGGQTTAIVVYNNIIKNFFVNKEGGNFITKDISIILNIPFENAEVLKNDYGCIIFENKEKYNEIPFEMIGKFKTGKVNEKYLSSIIKARIKQIFNKINLFLNNNDIKKNSDEIVLTGGNANFSGIVELAQKIFNLNVKLYVSNNIGLRDPIFINVVSIVEFYLKLDNIYHIVNSVVDFNIIKKNINLSVENNDKKSNILNNKKVLKNNKFLVKIKNFFLNIFE